MPQSTKDKAEEMLSSLQRRAKEWLDAEEGLIHTIRDAIETNAITPTELRSKLDTLLGQLKSRGILEYFGNSAVPLAAEGGGEAAPRGLQSSIQQYRSDLEQRAESSMRRLLTSLQVATKNDVDTLSEQIQALTHKLGDLQTSPSQSSAAAKPATRTRVATPRKKVLKTAKPAN